MSETKLLPCPMCGCDTPRDDVYIRDGREVQCPSCDCSVHAFNPDANKEAVAKWNTRIPDPRIEAAQGLADALRECEGHLEGTADADFNGERFVGNAAMDRLTTVRNALAAWEKLQ